MRRRMKRRRGRKMKWGGEKEKEEEEASPEFSILPWRNQQICRIGGRAHGWTPPPGVEGQMHRALWLLAYQTFREELALSFQRGWKSLFSCLR